MTEMEVKNIATTAAKEAAKEALQEFLLVLGVNVSTPADKLELQKDFAHLRTERTALNRVRGQILSTLTGSGVTAVIAAIFYYLQHGPK